MTKNYVLKPIYNNENEFINERYHYQSCLGKAKDRPNLGQPDRTKTIGPTKWAFNDLGPSSVWSSLAIRSWTEWRGSSWSYGERSYSDIKVKISPWFLTLLRRIEQEWEWYEWTKKGGRERWGHREKVRSVLEEK